MADEAGERLHQALAELEPLRSINPKTQAVVEGCFERLLIERSRCRLIPHSG